MATLFVMCILTSENIDDNSQYPQSFQIQSKDNSLAIHQINPISTPSQFHIHRHKMYHRFHRLLDILVMLIMYSGLGGICHL